MSSKLPSIKDIDVKGKRVLIRLDLNVPTQDSEVLNAFRIKKQLPTLKFLQDQGARIIGISHISHATKKDMISLKPVYEYLKNELLNVSFFEGKEIGAETIEQSKQLANGHMLLLENLRFNKGEEGNDEAFAKELSELGDIYVNEAFSASHREHASIVGVPQHLPHYAGLLLQTEIENLSKAFSPEQPFYMILGGAKFSTKLPLVEKFLDSAEKIFVCGALAHDFYVAQGLEVGKSLVDQDVNIEHLLDNEKISLPTDVVVQTTAGKETKNIVDVSSEDVIFDAGPQYVDTIINTLSDAKFILWNGPLGNYEYGFKEGTETLAKGIAHLGAFSIVGGGDTVASIEEYNIEDKFGFVSTGGGAMLEFLANGTLPGLEALK